MRIQVRLGLGRNRRVGSVAFRLAPNASAILEPLKDHSVPVMIAQGDADELVPVAGARQWVDTMKEMKMVYNYKEVPGATHGSSSRHPFPISSASSRLTPSK